MALLELPVKMTEIKRVLDVSVTSLPPPRCALNQQHLHKNDTETDFDLWRWPRITATCSLAFAM
jgi:hypothetical protein